MEPELSIRMPRATGTRSVRKEVIFCQKITSFRTERVPVALGILIDNSGSMLPKRTKVNQAALRLVDASQEDDRVFVVNFGEDAFLDQDYTQDVEKLKAALQR